MDSKDKLISRQVALKGAIELACHSDMYFETTDEILATAEILQNWILNPFSQVAENPVVNTPVAKKQPSPQNNITDNTEISTQQVGQGNYVCPCPSKSKVYDNRLDKKSENSPNFKCGAGQQCQGGSTGKDGKTYAWASWSDEPPAEIMPNYKPQELVQPKSLDEITDSDTPF